MADLLARIGVLLVVITLVLPEEFSDTLLDILTLFLLAYGTILLLFIIAELLDINILGEGVKQR